ncbi:MAG: MerR family transcriptional regulator [Mycobacteriales bacterium]
MAEYRVDDLAAAAGTTVRNVRVYQDRGLLPPPRREGRVGVYTEAHLARLRLIGALLDRGYTFSHIGEFISAWQHGRDLTDVLGLADVLTTPWSDEIADYVTGKQLLDLFGPDAPVPELLARALSQRLLEVEGERFRVRSPRLLHAGAELVAAGIPLPAVLHLDEALAGDLDRIARRLVQLVADHFFAGRPAGWAPQGDALADVVALVARLRPLAQMSIEAHLALAMDRAVRDLLSDRLSALGAEEGA